MYFWRGEIRVKVRLFTKAKMPKQIVSRHEKVCDTYNKQRKEMEMPKFILEACRS